jgi:hypothetical protein
LNDFLINEAVPYRQALLAVTYVFATNFPTWNKAKNALSLACRFLPTWRGKDTKKMGNARSFRKKSIIAV